MERQLDINIEPCGLFIDKTYPFIGATPDGLVEDDVIVEVKCPISSFKIGIDAAIKTNKIQIYKYNKENKIRQINTNSNWYYQVQGQLHVTQRKTCIFGIWSGEHNPVQTEYIHRDDEFWKKKTIDFYMKCLLPEIVDPRHIRGMPMRAIILKETQSKEVGQSSEIENQIVSYQPRQLNFDEF